MNIKQIKEFLKDGEGLNVEFKTGGTISNQIFAVESLDDFGEMSYV